MAINPNEYTISYSQLIRSTTIRDRVNMAQSDNTFYSQLAQVLTPTQMANLFPRYYRDRLPDISGFQLATSQIAAGKFGEGLPSSPITSGASSEYVSPRPTKSKRELEAESSLTGKVNEERLRKLLPEKAKKTFDEVIRNKKTQSFSSTDDPFSGLSDAELKSIGIKRSQQAVHPQSTRNIYTKDTMSVEAAKKKVLSEFKSESKVSGFKFDNPPTTFKDNRLTGNYYATHGAGMGNKEDNAKIQTELANYIAKKGKEAGYTDAAIKGMVANAIAESNLGLLPYGDYGGSGGVFHLHVRGAAAEAGVDPKKYHVNKSNVKDVDEYIASMKDSIDESFDLFQNNKNYASLNELMKTSNSFEETTTAFVRDFEKPAIVNAADRIAQAKRMGIDVVTLDETIPVDSMPKFIQVMKSMDGETLKKLGGIIETGPGGIGAGVDIVDFAEKLQTPEEFNKAEADLAKIMYEKGLTGNAATAEKVDDKKRTLENFETEDPYEFWEARNPRNATLNFNGKKVSRELLTTAMMAAKKFESENPGKRVELYGPGAGYDVPGSDVGGTRDSGRHTKALAGDFAIFEVDTESGEYIDKGGAYGNYPNFPKHRGGLKGTAMAMPLYKEFHDNQEMARIYKAEVEDIESYKQGHRFGTFFTDVRKDIMHTDIGGGVRGVGVSAFETQYGSAGYGYKDALLIESGIDPNSTEGQYLKQGIIEKYGEDKDAIVSAAKQMYAPIENTVAEEKTDTGQAAAEEMEEIYNEGNKGQESLGAGAYDRVPEGKNDSPLANSVVTNVESESIVTPMGMYEGGIINTKDNLKVVREDGSPTGIRVASDETAVIIPPDERRKARDFVSLDGTDQRTGLDSMDETTNTTKPGEAPLNQAKMSTAGYSPSNQSTIPSSLGAIDYSPSAIRAFARDKYVDNHGFHSAPRTIYAQK